MSVNDLNYEQIAAILNDINKAVTGNEQSIAPKNTKQFVSVATTLVKSGLDPLRTAVSLVLSDTIFSIRPYESKFKNLRVTRQRFGAITRKLTPIDREAEEDTRYVLQDGGTVDHYKISQFHVLMTNFYGQAVYKRRDTTFTDQLLGAFKGPDQLGEFFSMKESNMRNLIEQDHESTARMTVANFAAGKYASNNGVIHCLTEYNAHTGLSLDDQTVYQPDNFRGFSEWLFSRIDQLSKKLTERSGLYQIQVTGKEVNRHTPLRDQRVYLYNPIKTEIEKRVTSGVYNESYLRWADNEGVNFWQNIAEGEEQKISVQPSYMNSSGNIVESATTVAFDKLIGVITDRDAMGYTVFNQKAINTPVNADGDYYNTVYHFTERYWNDFTEKGIILLMD